MKKKILFLFIVIILIGAKFSFAETNIAVKDTIYPPPNNFDAVEGWYSIHLSWNEPSQGNYNLIGYNLYREDIGLLFFLNDITYRYYFYSDYMVFLGTEYTYWVTAVYEEGESEPSNSDSTIPWTNIYWWEDFGIDYHLMGWTEEPDTSNWYWSPGYARFNWSPPVINFDHSLISPKFIIPEFSTSWEITFSMYANDYPEDSGEVFEIIIVHDSLEDVIWHWDMDDNDDWGSPGGTDFVYESINQYNGELCQFKFRAYGDSTYNINYWYIYSISSYIELQPDYGALVGSVTEGPGFPIEGFAVHAEDIDYGSIYYNVLTDENGEYAINPMLPGIYYVLFTKEGYSNFETILEIPPGDTITLDLIGCIDILTVIPEFIDTTINIYEVFTTNLTAKNNGITPFDWFAYINFNKELNEGPNCIETLSLKEMNKFIFNPTIPSKHTHQDSSWLFIYPSSGTLEPGDSSLIELTFDGTGQTQGTVLTADIIFTSDPDIGTVIIPVTLTITESGVDDVPDISTKLNHNFPNPFSTSTTIVFNLATNLHENTQIISYNLKGQLVKILECGESLSTKATEALYSLSWDGKDENDKPVSSGIYFYQLKIEEEIIDTKKCLLLK